MSEHRDSSNYGGLSNPTLLHTLQRHREILRDCTAEFHRTHENIRTQLERLIALRLVKEYNVDLDENEIS